MTEITEATAKQRQRQRLPEDYRKCEVAELLNTSLRTVERMVAKKQIPGAYKLGAQLRFDRKAFDIWKASGCKAA